MLLSPESAHPLFGNLFFSPPCLSSHRDRPPVCDNTCKLNHVARRCFQCRHGPTDGVGERLINEQPTRETMRDCVLAPLPLGLRDALPGEIDGDEVRYRIIYNPPTGAFILIIVMNTHVQEKALPSAVATGWQI